MHPVAHVAISSWPLDGWVMQLIGSLFTFSKVVAIAWAVAITMIASVVLLSIRVWSGTSVVPMSGWIARLVDGAIALMVVLFLVLVVVRFKYVG